MVVLEQKYEHGVEFYTNPEGWSLKRENAAKWTLRDGSHKVVDEDVYRRNIFDRNAIKLKDTNDDGTCRNVESV